MRPSRRGTLFAAAVGLAGLLTGSCGDSAAKTAPGPDALADVAATVDASAGGEAGGADAVTGDAVTVPLATCRFRCHADVDCCAFLGLGAGCPDVYPNRAVCVQPLGLCEWHFNCEQESDCRASQGAAYSCISPSGSPRGFCRKACAGLDDCAGESNLFDPPGRACTGGRCYGDGKATDGGFVGVDPASPPGPCQSDQMCLSWMRAPAPGLAVAGPYCQAGSGRCVACRGDGDCVGNASGTTCSVATGSCGCRDETGCRNGLVCGY